MIEIYLESESTVVCRPSGRLDWMAACRFRRAVSESLRPGFDIVIDLGRVGSIDSVGISAILGVVRRARSLGVTAMIRNVLPPVRRWFDLVVIDPALYGQAAGSNDDAA